MNYNIRLSLWWTVLENVSGSIRAGDSLSAFVYLLTGKNSTVGFIQGVNGVMQLLTAFPAGVIADRTRRDAVLRAGAAIGLAGGATLWWAVARAKSAMAVAVAMALLGTYRGVYSPAMEAIFADSVVTGRTGPYTWRYVAMAMSFGAGPLISLLVFLNLGDTWTLRDCRLVVLVGVVCMLPALCLMCFFDDDKTLAHHSEAIVPLLEEAVEEDAELAATPGQESSIPQEREPGRSFWTPTIVVPILLTSSDFLAALASGMTIKFFSLFFMQHLEFSPSAVSLLSVASPFGVSAASLAAQSVAKRVGRVQLNLMLRLVDVCLLVTMAKLPTTPGTATAVLVAVHLTRMAAANCSSPLLRSVLNQFVPKRHRGKVNAVDSVKMFSWSGSAALGGILVERLGFEGTFLVTAAIKLTAILPLLGVLRYVPDGFFAGGAARSKHAAPEPSPALAAGVTTSWPVNMAEGEGETSAEDDEQTMYSNGDAVSIHVPKATPTF